MFNHDLPLASFYDRGLGKAHRRLANKVFYSIIYMQLS
jgi:hypothetical protein